ncbi:MAG: hypothetical protein PWP02_957 [Thermosipho sp. (in: thermotogales)]|jgi:hypothetical protein|nr:hypothetical protein [Petrotoga sp.]MDN5325242.1 hypothetical protein [Thermosipho sp. (in: thermotogales)]
MDYDLIYCINDIKYRKQMLIKSWQNNDINIKFSELRALIFSIGSSMDILRNTIFNEYSSNNKSKKYFTDIFEKGKISQKFKSYIREKFGDELFEDIKNYIENLGEILLSKKIQGFNKPIALKGEKCKKFSVWDIYNSLKHSFYPKESPIKAYFYDSLAGHKGELVIEINDLKASKKYYIHFFGGYIFPEGYRDKEKEGRNRFLEFMISLVDEILKNLEKLRLIIDHFKCKR